jgi:hypothetical protein
MKLNKNIFAESQGQAVIPKMLRNLLENKTFLEWSPKSLHLNCKSCEI